MTFTIKAKKQLRLFGLRALRPVKSSIEMADTIWLSRLTRKALYKKSPKRPFRYSLFRRVVTSWTQPWNPFGDEKDLPDIEIFIPCHPKDLSVLRTAIEMGIFCSNNPVTQVTLATPQAHVDQLKKEFPPHRVLSDEEILGENLIGSIKQIVPKARWGWAIQQLLKIKFSLTAESLGVLIVDSDTTFTAPVTWISEQRVQRLSISYEFHPPYATNTEQMWGENGRSTGFSFVTHFQLFQPDILQRMFPSPDQDFKYWMENTNWKEQSAFSEYHSYGTWLINTFPDRVKLASWGNQISVDTSQAVKPGFSPRAYIAQNKGIGSISFHSYLTD